MISGVYKISSLRKPERCYIGSSKDIHKRWEVHLRELKKQKHHAIKLQRHYDKYGKNDLIFSILIGCEKEELISTEQYFLDVYNSYFNGMKKAGSNGGFNHTEKAKRRISEAQMGDKNPNYGRKFSEEHRKKMSDAMKGRTSWMKGRKHSEETKVKLSEANKGKRNSPATEFKKGQVPSEEKRKQVSEKLKGRIPWNKGKPMEEETRQKLSASMTGKLHPSIHHKHTLETKKKMSESRTNYYMKKRLLNIITN